MAGLGGEVKYDTRMQPKFALRWSSTLLLVLSVGMSAGSVWAEGPGTLTAQQVIDRIKAHTGGSWSGDTVDTFKAGDPNTPVTGIVTTFAATFDVLQRAAADGKNLIITHEPTFYSHQDLTEPLAGDAVYQTKLDFIQEHHMVVWRFHDHWHSPAMTKDGIMQGMITALGWEKFQSPESQVLFTFPETDLTSFANSIRSRLKIRNLRTVGDPKLKVQHVFFLPGAAGAERQIKALEQPGVDVLVVGEAREWETVEYARDAASQGKPKALIILGHVMSEESGMIYCAEWLKTFVKEVPIEFIPAREPFL
jgi:putative NIF3 family GTP cyclohydrolase 1 type 2